MVAADCEVMEQMATSPWLRISISTNLLLLSIAFPVVLKAMLTLRHQKLFHFNTRMQIQVHLFGLILHYIGRFGLHTSDLHNYFSDFENGCSILPNFYRCLITRGLYNIGMTLCSMTSISLVIERSVALYYSSTYEYCPKSFGFALAFLQFFLTFCFLFNLYYYAPFKPNPEIPLYYCQTLASGSGTVWTINGPLYCVLISQIICRIIFHFLFKESQKIRNTHHFLSLSSRYNLDQGIRSINALKMFINANTLVNVLLAVCGTTLHFNSKLLSRPTYFAIVEAVHIWPTYGILLSFSVYCTLNQIDRRMKVTLHDNIKTSPDYYFRQFNKQIG